MAVLGKGSTGGKSSGGILSRSAYGTNEQRAGSARAREDAEEKQRDFVVKDDPISNEIRVRPLKFLESLDKKDEADRKQDDAFRRLKHKGVEGTPLVERPSYLERVREKTKSFPDFLEPLGFPLAAIAEAPAVRAIGEALGTDKPEEEGYLPVKGAGKVAGQIIAPIGAALTVPGAQLGGGALYGKTGDILTRLAPRLGNTAAGRIAETAIKFGTEGAITGAGSELAINPDATGKELLSSAAYGAGGGALLGGLGKGIGEGIGILRNRSGNAARTVQEPETIRTSPEPVRHADEPLRAPQEAASTSAEKQGNWFVDFMRDLFASKGDSMGISAFGKKVGQKLRTPDNPERVTDLIDVGGRADRKEGGSAWEKFYTAIVNEQAPMPRAVKQIAGKNVEFDKDPSTLAWLSRGWKGKADTKLQYGFMDEAGNKIGSSLKEAIEPIKNRLDDLREYSVALRSLEYGDLESGVPRELAEKTIQKYQGDEQLKSAYESFKKYIDDMNQETLVQSGLWSAEKKKLYKETQPNYIPMFRTQEKGLRDGIQGAGGKGFGNVKDPTKKRTGSRRPIVDPIESVIKQTYKNQALAERNNVMRSLVDLAEANPENGIVVPVKGSSALEEIQRSLDSFIENPTGDMEKQLTDALDLLKPQTVNGKPNVFTVMRDGRAEQWQIIDDQLAKVVAGLGGEPSNPLINMVGKATGVLKAGLVLAPDFVVKNLVRDQMSAFINSKYGYIPLWDMVSGLWSAAKKDDAFYKWMGSGGANGSWVSLERDYLQGQIRDLTQKNIRKMGNPIEVLRKLSEWSEQGTRLGEFKRGLKKGASLKQSALASRDVTLDFSRIGSKTKSANKAIAFFNVAVQSIDKMARQLDPRNPKQAATALTKAAISITIPSVGLYLLNHKNPKYEELPQWEKDTHWHFFFKGLDQPIKVPKPFEMGTLFGTFFERMMRDMREKDPKAFDGFAKQVFEGFSPSIIPTLITPWIEAYANKDMFSKAPIVPRREQGLLPKDQYGPYTGEIAKGIGKITNTSPRIVENYVTGYTGTLGRYGLQFADKLYTNAKDIKTPAKADGGLSDIPVLRSFASKGLEGSSQSVDDFYKERDRLTRERASSKKSGKEYENEAKYKEYNKIADGISEEQAKVRAVMEDMTMTPAQKREELKVLNLKIINLARQAKGLKPIQ